jgi:hypothetical protein
MASLVVRRARRDGDQAMLSEDQRSTILAAICLSILVLIASLAAWSGAQPELSPLPASANAPSDQQYKQTNRGTNNKNHSLAVIYIISGIGSFIDDYSDDITAISTGILAIITGLLVYVARNQYLTSQQQLRAYVSGGPKFIYSFTATSAVSCAIHLRRWCNSGLQYAA